MSDLLHDMQSWNIKGSYLSFESFDELKSSIEPGTIGMELNVGVTNILFSGWLKKGGRDDLRIYFMKKVTGRQLCWLVNNKPGNADIKYVEGIERKLKYGANCGSKYLQWCRGGCVDPRYIYFRMNEVNSNSFKEKYCKSYRAFTIDTIFEVSIWSTLKVIEVKYYNGTGKTVPVNGLIPPIYEKKGKASDGVSLQMQYMQGGNRHWLELFSSTPGEMLKIYRDLRGIIADNVRKVAARYYNEEEEDEAEEKNNSRVKPDTGSF